MAPKGVEPLCPKAARLECAASAYSAMEPVVHRVGVEPTRPQTRRPERRAYPNSAIGAQCTERELNPHAFRHQALNLARLPVPPSVRNCSWVYGCLYTEQGSCGAQPPVLRQPTSGAGYEAIPGRVNTSTRAILCAREVRNLYAVRPRHNALLGLGADRVIARAVWVERDSNSRRPKPSDLQSGAIAARRSTHAWQSSACVPGRD